MRLHRPIRELRPGTSVHFASPQREFRMRYVRHPLAVMLDVGFPGRYSRHVDGKLRLAIQTDQIEPALLPDYEQFLSIHAWCRIAEHERSYRQLRRFSGGLVKE